MGHCSQCNRDVPECFCVDCLRPVVREEVVRVRDAVATEVERLLADERAKAEAALRLADQVVHEAWRMLAGGDDGPAERCDGCGCGGYGYLRDALKAYHAARGTPVPRP